VSPQGRHMHLVHRETDSGEQQKFDQTHGPPRTIGE